MARQVWWRLGFIVEDDRGVRRCGEEHERARSRTQDSPLEERAPWYLPDFEVRPGTPQVRAIRVGRRLLNRESMSPVARRVSDGLCLLVCLATIGGGIAAIVHFYSSSGSILLTGSLVVMLALVLGMGFSVLSVEHRLRREDRETLATLPQVCVACTYDMSGLVAECDGCTVCPECGAAWRFPLRGPWAKARSDRLESGHAEVEVTHKPHR